VKLLSTVAPAARSTKHLTQIGSHERRASIQLLFAKPFTPPSAEIEALVMCPTNNWTI
jgi:hypothetical protein